MVSYKTLKQNAEDRWTELTSVKKPWIRIGTAMCGQAAGSYAVLDSIKAKLKEKNIDAVVSETGCLGICYAEPLLDVAKAGKARLFFGNVTPEDIDVIVDGYIVNDHVPDAKALGYLASDAQKPIKGVADLNALPGIARQQRIALRNAGHTDPGDIYQYIANGGYFGLDKALNSMDDQAVLKEVTDSGLRGRGGAAFPTGVKWSFLVRSNAPKKYILCNCEEGDPGAVNDKTILESDPFTLIEGITLAGYATRSTNGFVFIRHGHDGPIDRTEEAIRQAYEHGLLGNNILGSDFNFDVEVALTGESYVAGEETALMEAIEGNRSMPRARPPFPAAYGVWGRPSNINNVKTLAYVPEIIAKGAEWFSSIGVNKSKGTAIICLNGHIARPGLYEIPMGLTIGEVVNDIGGGVPDGKDLKMLQTGGPLGGVLPASSVDTPIDFEEMSKAGAILGSGGVIIGNSDVCAVDLTRNLVAFEQYESCGKCFPCRLGTTNLLEIVDRILGNKSRPGDLELMRSVGKTMQAGSLCGHGQLGFNPIRSAIEHFETDFQVHMTENRCPTGSCETANYMPITTRPFTMESAAERAGD